MQPSNSISPALDRPSSYALNDLYEMDSGRVYASGTQALVLINIMQRRFDRLRGINSNGFVSGYRGSPLGAVDLAMWRASTYLDRYDIKFLPAINEDLAATAILGTQQVEVEPSKTVDGVFAMWYGKGPGVDRAGDALKHGNAYGSSPHGGVLVVAGDDHGCASSSMSHQSDVAFMANYIPTLNPASVAEYVEFGLYGYALSRYSGCWVGFKAVSETVESVASIELPPLPDFKLPDDFERPEGGLNFRWPDLPGMQIETRMQAKKEAIRAFARANPIDKVIFNSPQAKFGIITTGKAHLDVMEALALLGLDGDRAQHLGIAVYKIGLVWPLETQGAEGFLSGKEEVLVIEEKRGLIESQLKEYLYDRVIVKPNLILGKHDEKGQSLISWVDELSPSMLLPILAKRIQKLIPAANFSQQLQALTDASQLVQASAIAKRTPYFCSGCPHNTSTRVPEGSRALAGIGCHFMASWMDRNTNDLIQMGGEGVNWAAKSMFLQDQHIFQNLGDGTYYHSGSMAIRQSVAAGANITYKLLFNEAVAMTGGQPLDGPISVPQIATQLLSEGVKKVAIVSDQPERSRQLSGIPAGVKIYHRDELDTVQRELREIKGVTALIYEQMCAAEKRRKRKRGHYPDPAKRLFINDLVCEGCGDCSTQSNCLSVVPKETEFGRKRMIDQSSCNKDYSCVKGFCPSFVSVEGGELKKPDIAKFGQELSALIRHLPNPKRPQINRAYNLLVAGVGGTGVVTIGALITMAAHLEGKGASVLDFMGFAQKGGAVMSYVRLALTPDRLNQVRIDIDSADAAIVCDLVVGTDQRSLNVLRRDKTGIVANTHIQPTADFIRDRNVNFETDLRLKTIESAAGAAMVSKFDASSVAKAFLGDVVYANVLLLGYSWQRGLIPVDAASIERAIQINAVAIADNLRAFKLGRAAAVRPELLSNAGDRYKTKKETLEQLIQRRKSFLLDYQNQKYAQRYVDFLTIIRAKIADVEGSTELLKAVATCLFKLMAYKDEYEVARLYTDGSFRKKLQSEFSGNFTLRFHMAPPIFGRGLDAEGRPKKTAFGSWMYFALKALAPLRFLRGTPLDLFGYTEERRLERQSIENYRQRVHYLSENLTAENLSTAIDIALLPDDIRGFGPVKLAAARKAEERYNALLGLFNNPQLIAKAV